MPKDETHLIPIERIHRSISTPREHHDEVALERLAHWIRRRGLLQPILVRSIGKNEFEVVAGERRLLAAQRAGLTEIECRVREYPDPIKEADLPGDVFALEDALIENLVRENLSKLEESEAILNLVCLHLGEQPAFVIERLAILHHRARKQRLPLCMCDDDDRILEVFKSLNLIGWQAFYTHRVPLLNLPDDVKSLVHRRCTSYALARRIGKLEPIQRRTVVARVKSGQLGGMTLKLELDKLLGVTHRATNRFSQIRRILPKHLENPRVKQSLENLERELGLS
jgi:ParB family transcriptional regulator, chromosome partitioning protein